MIEQAERDGLIQPGGTIVEPTVGNTGAGLALAAILRGYKAVFAMSEKMSKEKEFLLRAYGADVVRTTTNVPPEDKRSYYKVAARIAGETPGVFVPNQFENPNNSDIQVIAGIAYDAGAQLAVDNTLPARIFKNESASGLM